MEEFISNLIHTSNFIGGRTIVPGPMPTSSRVRAPVVLSSLEPVAGSSAYQLHATDVPPQLLNTRKNNGVGGNHSTQSASILKTDMSPMIAWLTSQSSCNDSQVLNKPVNNGMSETYTSEDYKKKIPKPYIELTARDCAGVVAQSIGSIVLHTCNDNFRRQCFTKLGASNSREVEREIKSRLNAIILQQEKEKTQTDPDGSESMEVVVSQCQSESSMN